MAVEQALTADEFDTWLTPREALKLLEPQFPDYAAHSWISKRLRSGQIRAAASCLHVPPNPPEIAIKPIPTVVWDELGEDILVDPLWIEGDLAVSLPGFAGMAHIVYNYLGVRFEPTAIRAQVPKSGIQPTLNAHEIKSPESESMYVPGAPPGDHPQVAPSMSGRSAAFTDNAALIEKAMGGIKSEGSTRDPGPEPDEFEAPRRRVKTVSNDLLVKFVSLHAQAFPGEKSEAQLQRAAEAYFRDRNVPRQRLRDAIASALGERRRGRPASGRGDPAN